MDGGRFDALARAVAVGFSRRRLLQGLIGGAAAGVLGSLSTPVAGVIICRQGGVLCAKDAHCCSGV